MASTFFMPTVNVMGPDALQESVSNIVALGLKRALIVTDRPLVEIGIVDKVKAALVEHGIEVVVFDGTQPNPTVTNVNDGLNMLSEAECDFVISLGGGSPHDCAKGIALVAANGGKIEDYEGVDVSAKPQMPLVAINTTAGTASEMTRFCIVTDEVRHVKMAIVDKHVTPIMSVNDPELMRLKPGALTAATGMDALTHAIEALVSTAATPVTDASAEKAIELIAEFLPRAVANGDDMEAREQMAYAQFLAGMAFNNASLGYVHAMAHQLGGFYDLPHGVCNAILLPVVQHFNAKVCAPQLAKVALLMGAEKLAKTDKELASEAIEMIEDLSAEVGIPAGLSELNVVNEADFKTLAENAMKDACGLTNPIQPTLEEVVCIYHDAM